MREIVLDTETTGTDPADGHRVVEFGGLELLNHVPTGRTFHVYLNPGRAMPVEAFEVHGLSDAFLADKAPFADVADELFAFLADAALVAHNAAFDVGFLNAEFARTGHGPLDPGRVIDTLAIARRRHPNASNSLDALCGRYGIDNARRTKHGALLDAELLAEVYVELLGGRQADLGLAMASATLAGGGPILVARAAAPRPPRPPLDGATLAAHAAFVATLGEGAVWRDYLGEPAPVS